MSNITDTDRLNFLDEIIEYFPEGYDGLSYGRFDLFFKTKVQDLRTAIDDEIKANSSKEINLTRKNL